MGELMLSLGRRALFCLGASDAALNLNPALNTSECAAAVRAGKARGGRKISPCNDEQASQRGSFNSLA
jgi:hypothetical protein